MLAPRQVPGTDIYAETNLSASAVMKRCRGLLKMFGHSKDELDVEFQEVND